jgi:xanthine dehydrogenase molybdopterin-binding subunit B/CO/xanthine dehydrogenase FAD-binding subunit
MDRSSFERKLEDIFSSCTIDIGEFHIYECRDQVRWAYPQTLAQLLTLLRSEDSAVVKAGHQGWPDTQLVFGNTDLGYKQRYHPHAHEVRLRICATGVGELQEVDSSSLLLWSVGAATTIQKFRQILERSKVAAFQHLAEHLKSFANISIRSMGTLGGSIIACDPLSDLLPPLRALNASLEIVAAHSGGKLRTVSVAQFVESCPEERMAPGDVLIKVFLPVPPADFPVLFKKVGKRKTDAQALVSAAFSPLCACFSGISSQPATVLDDAKLSQLDSYRRSVIEGLSKMYDGSSSTSCLLSAPAPFHSERTCAGTRVASHDSVMDPMMRELIRGTVPFVRDLPAELFAAFAHFHGGACAENLCVHLDDALLAPGVVDVVTAADIPKGQRTLGTVVFDEEVFASDTIAYHGQPVALVVAASMQEALDGARLVRCSANLLPPVTDLQDAVQKQSFHNVPERVLERGDLASLSRHQQASLTGTISVGGQEHFYIEPQVVRVSCGGSGDDITCWASCQNPSLIQRGLARVLGVSQAQVRVIVNRIGGGFGGKQDRPQFLAAACAVAARKTGRTVQLALERESDMVITGQRHPFVANFEAYLEDGVIKGLNIESFVDGGHSLDLSLAVAEVGLFAMDGCYFVENMRLAARVCRTNRPSNTAFRGFGKPQGTIIIEQIFERCAEKLKVSPDELRWRQLYRAHQPLLSGFPVTKHNTPEKLVSSLLQRSNFEERKLAVAEWNASHPHVKRGIAWIATKNNTGFDQDLMNQGTAIINCYTDGSIVVHVGGVEMGQGLKRKLQKIVAEELGTQNDALVSVKETDTSIVANTTPTAATTGTELNGIACVDACKQLRERLARFGGSSFAERVKKAYENKVSLQAIGRCEQENFAYNFSTKTGDWSWYYIYGAACAEVEVSMPTGEWRVIRVDILQETGKRALHPVIDIGQIEGGFAQGMGFCTMEELIWSPKDGHLRSRNVSTYKVPAADDMPRDLRIHLVEVPEEEGRTGVLGSKTVGEAGVQHGLVVHVALSRALENSSLAIPATVQKIAAAK